MTGGRDSGRDGDETLDPDALDRALDEAYEADPNERRAVVRGAVDLADDGRATRDRGEPLTVDVILDELDDAPADASLAGRWNWWLGAMEVAYGGYEPFQVRRYAAGDREDEDRPTDDSAGDRGDDRDDDRP